MPRYLVSWEVDIDADSPLEAARQAHGIVRRKDTLANVYQVTEHDGTGEAVTVDLAEDYPPPPADWDNPRGDKVR